MYGLLLLNVAYIPLYIQQDREMTVQNTKLKDFVAIHRFFLIEVQLAFSSAFNENEISKSIKNPFS